MKLKITDFIKDQWTALPLVSGVDLSAKTVIVTGANVGLGLETAKHFARMHPGRLIVTCRSAAKGAETVAEIRKETGCATVEAWVLELAEFSSVKAFAERFAKEGSGGDGGRLDILVENAAVSPTQLEFTKDGWESTTQINVLSTSLLALLLLPRMLETAQKYNTTPRILVATSELHHMARFDADIVNSGNFFRRYAYKDDVDPSLDVGKQYFGTKVLTIFFVRALSARLHRKPLITSAPNPGLCRTSLRRDFTGAMYVATTLLGLVLGRSAECGSRVFVWAALSGEEQGSGEGQGDGDGEEGRRDELRGAYISSARVDEPSDYIVSEEGRSAQDKIWDNLIEELTKIEPRVQQIVKECLTPPASST